MKKLLTLSTSLVLAACGDDMRMNTPDAPIVSDAEGIDAPIDAPQAWTKPTPTALNLSAAGPDRMYSIAVGADGKFYVAGYVAATVAGDKKIVVMRLLPNGTPDTTWAANSTFDTGVVFKGGDGELNLRHVGGNAFVVSATVAAAVTNAADAADTDIGLIKIKNNGSNAAELDTTFGGGDGIAVHSLNTSALLQGTTTNQFSRDAARGLFVDTNGAIFIHAISKANGNVQGGNTARTDTDFVVAKLTADGTALDNNFSTDGKVEVDLYNNGASQHTNATPRAITVLGDGSILAGGYANAGLTTGPQIVMFRLSSNGTLDANFAPTSSIPGVFHSTVLQVQTEMYGFSMHGNDFVTGGYGRNTGTINDWISLRFNASTAARSTTWGGSGFTDGKVFFDPTPTNTASGSTCRNVFSLPGDKTILLGSSNRDDTANGMTANQDAVFAILDENGALDTEYGTGIALYQLGATDGADMFWGAAANSTHVLIVGWRGGTVTPQTDTDNDNAYAVLLPLE